MGEFQYSAWLCWMRDVYYKPQPIPGYTGYTVDRLGNVYKDDQPVSQFNSNGYKQICLTRNGERRVVKGVHQIVSMTFDPEYYDGCVVHHKDEDKTNNNTYNLKVESRSDHARHHADPAKLLEYTRKNGSPTKGKKMSDEFREHCRQSAIKRRQREKQLCGENLHNNTYNGNQFRNADGSKKNIDPAWYEKFREACRRGAEHRKKNK